MLEFKLSDLISKISQTLDKSNIDNINKVVLGTIVAKNDGFLYVDVGLKTEGIINEKEFADHSESELQIGSQISVSIVGFDTKTGIVDLSRDLAMRESAWNKIVASYEENTNIEGIPFSKVKGSVLVDVSGIICFLQPNHQISSTSEFTGSSFLFRVISLNEKNKTAYLSQKAIADEEQRELKREFLSTYKEGDVISGVVINIFDYGVVLSCNKLNVLVQTKDISWQNISHPSEMLKLGDQLDIKVMKLNKDTGLINASIKHLQHNPWLKIASSYSLGQIISAEVSEKIEYGVFCKISNDLIGLLHVSELSWESDEDAAKILSNLNIGDKLDLMVIEIDTEKQRISLSQRRKVRDPWKEFVQNNTIGDVKKLRISNINHHGIFVEIDKKCDCLIRTEEVAHSNMPSKTLLNFHVGDEVEAMYIGVEKDSFKINFSIKACSKKTYQDYISEIKSSPLVKCKIIDIQPERALVNIVGTSFFGFINKIDVSYNKAEQSFAKFKTGDQIDAKVMSSENDIFKFSIKASEAAIRQENMDKYNEKQKSTSIADMLQAAIKKENI